MAMKDNFLRKYVGTGDLTFSFCSLKKCAFELHCYNEGRLRLICDTIASQDFFEILKHDTDKNKVAQLQASLHGKTNDFRFLDMSKTPADSEKRIFEAAWSDLGRPAPAAKKS